MFWIWCHAEKDAEIEVGRVFFDLEAVSRQIRGRLLARLDYFSMFTSDPLIRFPIILQIKFIVDGRWKVDPLRPIVYNNGFQNNLFTVT